MLRRPTARVLCLPAAAQRGGRKQRDSDAPLSSRPPVRRSLRAASSRRLRMFSRSSIAAPHAARTARERVPWRQVRPACASRESPSPGAAAAEGRRPERAAPPRAAPAAWRTRRCRASLTTRASRRLRRRVRCAAPASPLARLPRARARRRLTRVRSAAAQEDSWQVISSYFEAKGLVRQQLVRAGSADAAAASPPSAPGGQASPALRRGSVAADAVPARRTPSTSSFRTPCRKS